MCCGDQLNPPPKATYLPRGNQMTPWATYGLMQLSRDPIAFQYSRVGELWVHLRVIFAGASFAKTFEYLDG